MASKKVKKGKKKGNGEEQIQAEATLESQFQAFAKFDDVLADGKTMTLRKNDIWMKQADVVDMKNITTTDTGICWIQYKKRCLNFEEYLQFLQDLADRKGTDLDEIVQLLIDCGNPGDKPRRRTRELQETRNRVEPHLFGENT